MEKIVIRGRRSWVCLILNNFVIFFPLYSTLINKFHLDLKWNQIIENTMKFIVYVLYICINCDLWQRTLYYSVGVNSINDRLVLMLQWCKVNFLNKHSTKIIITQYKCVKSSVDRSIIYWVITIAKICAVTYHAIGLLFVYVIIIGIYIIFCPACFEPCYSLNRMIRIETKL